MTQHTSRLCKGYLTRKESDGVLHQITWPPQLHNLHPIETVWDELDRRVTGKHPTSAQHVGTPSRLLEKHSMKLVERMPRVCKAVINAKVGYFEESEIFVSFHSCDVYNVENSKNKENPLNE
jgi:hypothetical protein